MMVESKICQLNKHKHALGIFHSIRGPGSVSKSRGNASLAQAAALRRAGRSPLGETQAKFQPMRCQESARGIVLRNEVRTKGLGSLPPLLLSRDDGGDAPGVRCAATVVTQLRERHGVQWTPTPFAQAPFRIHIDDRPSSVM